MSAPARLRNSDESDEEELPGHSRGLHHWLPFAADAIGLPVAAGAPIPSVMEIGALGVIGRMT
jgi:hypothetical protein